MSASSELLTTPLHAEHIKLNAKMVNFGGWDMPVSYTSQVEEHHSVRRQAGMFDVSHMTVLDLTGKEVLPFLAKLLANDINKACKLAGKALYSCMLNNHGGVIDDLIVYCLHQEHCRLVTNAATREKDLAWIQQQASNYEVTLNEKPELALIAVQGPNAIAATAGVLNQGGAELIQQLKRFQGGFANDLFIGRTGYTGEDGVEIILPGTAAVALWQKLLQAQVKPCGLGARDTLRLEAGMALYGNDLDEQHTPIESGLKWTVALNDERDFIGKAALSTPPRVQTVGLVLEDKGVLRSRQKVLLNGREVGETTSGGFSPSLNQSIALARIEASINTEENTQFTVQIRQKSLAARVVKYPFYTPS